MSQIYIHSNKPAIKDNTCAGVDWVFGIHFRVFGSSTDRNSSDFQPELTPHINVNNELINRMPIMKCVLHQNVF